MDRFDSTELTENNDPASASGVPKETPEEGESTGVLPTESLNLPELDLNIKPYQKDIEPQF